MVLPSDNENEDDSRPKTVKLQTTSDQESREDTDNSIGDTFFSAQENNSANSLHEPTERDTTSQDEKENNNRPKTVTTKRTDEYRQRLVDVGAVSKSEEESQAKRPYSPKPKSQTCYICGKEFLISSLKIHEKQCAKKNAKEQEKSKTEEPSPRSINRPSKIPRKLKLDACYLCGKEFLTHSLPIHETQCLKIWKANKTPTATDKTVAELKAASARDGCNSGQANVVESPVCDSPLDLSSEQKTSPKSPQKTENRQQKGLKTVPCSMCRVEFFAHSLKIHETNCRARCGPEITNEKVKHELEGVLFEESGEQPEMPAIRSDNADTPTSTKIAKKPRTTTCAFCGQEFLRSSYAFHEKQCGSKQRDRENVDTKTRPTKKTVDKSPDENSAARGPKQNSVARGPKTEKCYICGKEMLKSSLKIHEQQCEKKSTILKNINQQTATATTPTRRSGTKPKTEVCYLCGEAFLASSIKVHETRCRKK